jgi:hypothetical protein
MVCPLRADEMLADDSLARQASNSVLGRLLHCDEGLSGALVCPRDSAITFVNLRAKDSASSQGQRRKMISSKTLGCASWRIFCRSSYIPCNRSRIHMALAIELSTM